jgi:acetylornithine deacetylase
MSKNNLKRDAVGLLKSLIKIKSYSGEENETAHLIKSFLAQKGIAINRKGNNIWAWNRDQRAGLVTILLNSHIDTIRPSAGWTIDPFKPLIKDDKLYGLGSTDAGAALVSLIATFLYFNQHDALPFNLIISATAEEETSGKNGLVSILNDLGKVDLAVVGEPTNMKMAIAEKGLMVLDCISHGKSGHVAHDVAENAIEKAMKDITWFHNFKFPEESQYLGPIQMRVTMIEAGVQHNIVPDRCKFTVDVRTTDVYSNKEILDIISKHIISKITPRSIHLNASRINQDNLLVQAAHAIGIELFVSPTTSDQAVIDAPSVKIGPGNSKRSHTSDEFIELHEIENGIDEYIKLLEKYAQLLKDMNKSGE